MYFIHIQVTKGAYDYLLRDPGGQEWGHSRKGKAFQVLRLAENGAWSLVGVAGSDALAKYNLRHLLPEQMPLVVNS